MHRKRCVVITTAFDYKKAKKLGSSNNYLYLCTRNHN